MERGKTLILRVSTMPLSLKMFCKDLLCELIDEGEYEVLAVSSAGRELDKLRECGIPVATVEMSRTISVGQDLRSLMRLIRLFRKYRPDIVHSLTPKAGLLSMMAAKVTGVPVRIHSFTGLIFPTAKGLKRLILKTTDRITCACATHVLPEGEGVAHDLIAGGITRKPLHVLGHGNLRGIDLDYYNPTEQMRVLGEGLRQKMGIPLDAFVYVYVGRVVHDKGIGELAEAFLQLIGHHHNAHLVLVGPYEQEDPLPPNTLSLIANTPQIHHIDRWEEDVRPYYAMADALVFPSHREGFPNVVLEAGAMGLPSIVTDINGSREIVRQGVNGVIISPHSPTELHDAMAAYINDSAMRRRHASQSRRLIAERYEASYVRRCLKEFYRQL